MTGFVVAALVLVALALLLLVRPWRRRARRPDASRREMNARIYRDQLAELERDLAAGTLAPDDLEQAREELQRRLLVDVAVDEPDTEPSVHMPRTSAWLAVVLPLAAAGLYLVLGTPAALAPGATEPEQEATMAQVEEMVDALARRLEQQPDDAKGWSMLARSYRVMGRYEEAARAFARVGPALERDADLLALYADTLATAAQSNLEGRPLQLVKAALVLDPDHAMALSLAATAAYQRKDFPEAARHWQRLLRQLPPDSEDARFLVKTLAEIGAPAADAAGTSTARH